MLLSRIHWFNAMLVIVVTSSLARSSEADEIRTWTDKQGRKHYSVFGTPGEAATEAPAVPAEGETTKDRFSVQASLRRTAIRDSLREKGRTLHRIGDEIRRTEESYIVMNAPGAPTGPLPPGKIQDLLDEQRSIFLAGKLFEEKKRETLDRLYRREKKTLTEIRDQWYELRDLRKEVEERYGSLPPWWSDRMDCTPCPPLGEVEEALKPRPEPEEEDEEPVVDSSAPERRAVGERYFA